MPNTTIAQQLQPVDVLGGHRHNRFNMAWRRTNATQISLQIFDISCQGCQRRCPAIKPESIHSRVDSGFFLSAFAFPFSEPCMGSQAELCLRCSEASALLPAGPVALFLTNLEHSHETWRYFEQQ
ncbi:hypothetical protein [Comamonas sp. B21-038]|uniref:hypothetical protein n=1 Tax=Comamonas sp. B21-038 TaxID=2918299 RepID=UPI001EFAF360|nr:hypothetical protein [Comamonas sp. B21-038]ULR91428.1 hypothetical protein MJ205_11585 [Comamonas sp. B21-038]